MKSTLLILSLLVSAEVWSCAYPHDVTPSTIDNLPILAFFHDSRDGLQCQIYLRESDNLLGLSRVHIAIIDENEILDYGGSIFMYKDSAYDLQTVEFTISKEKIPYSSIQIIAYETDGTPETGIHSCLFSFDLPLNVLYDHFKENKYSPYSRKHPDNSAIIEQFKKKKYTVNRRELPNQNTEPSVQNPEEQSTKFTEEQRSKIDSFEKMSFKKWPLTFIEVGESYISIRLSPEIYNDDVKLKEIAKSIATECAHAVGFNTVSYVVFKDDMPYWFSYYEKQKNSNQRVDPTVKTPVD